MFRGTLERWTAERGELTMPAAFLARPSVATWAAGAGLAAPDAEYLCARGLLAPGADGSVDPAAATAALAAAVIPCRHDDAVANVVGAGLSEGVLDIDDNLNISSPPLRIILVHGVRSVLRQDLETWLQNL